MEKAEGRRLVEVRGGADRRPEARRYSLRASLPLEGDLRRREVAVGAEPVVGRACASLSGMLSKLQDFREG